MHAATVQTTLLLLPLPENDVLGKSNFVQSYSLFFGASSFTSVNLIRLLLLYYVCTALLNCCVPGVALACMRCVPRITRGVPSSLLFVGSPRFCAAEAFFAVSVTAKIQQYAFILTLTNRKQCLPKSRKSINATHSFIGVRFFHIF